MAHHPEVQAKGLESQIPAFPSRQHPAMPDGGTRRLALRVVQCSGGRVAAGGSRPRATRRGGPTCAIRHRCNRRCWWRVRPRGLPEPLLMSSLTVWTARRSSVLAWIRRCSMRGGVLSRKISAQLARMSSMPCNRPPPGWMQLLPLESIQTLFICSRSRSETRRRPFPLLRVWVGHRFTSLRWLSVSVEISRLPALVEAMTC